MANLDGLVSGQSATIVFTSPDGVQNFQILESFTSSEDADILQETSIDGITRHPKLYKGWSGSFVIQRGNSFLDDYIVNAERNYYNGGDQVNLTINQTILDPSGAVSQYQYTGVVIKLDDAGNYSGTEIVKQNASFMASRRVRLA